jgi:hypothetical protein
MHLILLGDSTLDNCSYTNGGLDVRGHIDSRLPQGSSVSLLANDGACTRDVRYQLNKMPSTATHLVLSVGGNDALGHIGIFERPEVMNMFGAVCDLTDILDEFQESYRTCLDQVLAHSLPTVVCMIYNGAFPDPSYQRVLTTTARLFDDVIMECALDAGCPLVDLRRVCTDSADYFNPIEPGAAGGKKIASAILSALEPDQSLISFVYPSGGQSYPQECQR